MRACMHVLRSIGFFQSMPRIDEASGYEYNTIFYQPCSQCVNVKKPSLSDGENVTPDEWLRSLVNENDIPLECQKDLLKAFDTFIEK
jgi:hypothetical protein